MRQATAMANATGLVAGYALDALLGDPRRWHPVAGFGRAAGALEQRLYRPDRSAGAAFTAVAVGAPGLPGAAAPLATPRHPGARAALGAAGTRTVLGGRTLRHESPGMGRAL
uniref:cobalamin biosynthesis protein n=1 Tax=Micromonospora chalcea TaxID=1874 RepID=UPI0038F79A1D